MSEDVLAYQVEADADSPRVPTRRKPKATSPTQRSLAYLRKQGWLVAVVERWNPHARIRQDLLGVGDLLCLRGEETMLVQTTSASNMASRVSKIAEAEHIDAIRKAGWTVHVHGWRRLASGRWDVRIVDCS